MSAGLAPSNKYWGIGGLPCPTVMKNATRGDFTLLVPFYYDPVAPSSTHYKWLLSGGVPASLPGAGRDFGLYAVQGASAATVAFAFNILTTTRTAAANDSVPLAAGTHYMAAVTYSHSTPSVTTYLFKEGSANEVGSGTAVFTISDWDALELCLGNWLNSGSLNVHISADFPILGYVCRDGVLTAEQLREIWNGGDAPSFRDLFPETADDVEWVAALVNEHSDWDINAMKEYKPWDASDVTRSRVHWWDKAIATPSTGGSTYVALTTAIDDQVDLNGALVNSTVENADFFNPAADEGGFWQPGQLTSSTDTAAIAGSVPPIAAILNGSRTGTKPVFCATLGNSRMALLSSIAADDGSAVHMHTSLGYGFARARPAYFGGVIACNVGDNVPSGTSLYSRLETGSPPGNATNNRTRLGFGSTSVTLSYSNGQPFVLNDADVVTLRFDTRDPGSSDAMRTVQPYLVLLERPGAGSATARTNNHSAHSSVSAGTNVGTTHSTGSLSTTVATLALSGAVTNGATSCTVAGDASTWIGTYVHFAFDDDVNFVTNAIYNGSSLTVLTLDKAVVGSKDSATDVNNGPIGYRVIEAGDVDTVSDAGNPYVGVQVTATGTVEIIACGFYYTDKPNAVCPIIMGRGGVGEADQVVNEMNGELQQFLAAVDPDMLLLTYATQDVTDIAQNWADRLGTYADTLPILGAPEGAYASATFLSDTDFATIPADARTFALARPNVALFNIYESGYDVVSMAYSGYMNDGSHQTGLGSVFRNRLLWDAIEANPSLISSPSGLSTASRLIAMGII